MVALSVFVIARSAFAASVSVSVALSFVDVGSVTPDGALTVALFDNVPVADAETVAVNVYVAVPLDNKLAVVLIEPVPDVAPHAEPDEATHVHVAAVSVAGSVSVIVAPVTAEGPPFDATIV